MKRISRIVVVLLLLVIALGSCARQKPEPETPKQLDTTVNLVTSTVPSNGALGVLETSPIVLNFAKPMDKPTVEQSLSLFAGTYDPASNPTTFSPLQITYICKGTYKVTNPNTVALSFTWQAQQNANKPLEKGLGVVPANNSTFFYSAVNGKKATVKINNQAQPYQPNNQSPCNQPRGTFTWSNANKTLTYTPPTPLQANTDYTLTLASLAKATDNTTLETPYTLSFSTKLPALPDPWQRQQLIGTIGRSTYNSTTQTFTLSTSSTNSEESSHFIYQTQSIDASIEAKVQLAASSSTTSKAGVMLRQSNEATSPFVFAYIQDGRVKVDYLDPATNQVVTIEGSQLSSLTTARFLKIERKEGSVYVYESDNALNWTQVTVITLAITNPFNVGLVVNTANGSIQAQFESVLVKAQDNSEVTASFTATPTSGTVPLTVNFDASTSTGSNLTYEWDFGDGFTGTGKQISHTYQYAGTYFPNLKISNSQGTSTASDIFRVKSPDFDENPPLALSQSTTPEGKKEYAAWWTRHNLSQRGLLKLLDYVSVYDIIETKSFTPDRRWVIYHKRDYKEDGSPSPNGTYEYYLVNLETGEKKSIGKPTGENIASFALSRDAQQIAFREDGGGNTLHIMPTQTLAARQLVRFVRTGDELNVGFFLGGYTFSPDGTKLGLRLDYETPEGSSNYVSGFILLEIPTTASDLAIDVSTINSFEGFVEKVDFETIGGPENYGGMYWEGDKLKWYSESQLRSSLEKSQLQTQQVEPTQSCTSTNPPSVNCAGEGFLLLPYEENLSLAMTKGYDAGGSHSGAAQYSLDFDANSVEAEGTPIIAAVTGTLYSRTEINTTGKDYYPYESIFESQGRCFEPDSADSCSYTLSASNSRSANHVWVKALGNDGIWYFVRHTHLMYQSTPSDLRSRNTDIEQGQVVGLMSETGWVYSSNNTPVHLHFQVTRRANNDNDEEKPIIAIQPQPMDDEISFSIGSSYTSTNTLEDFQMSGPFKFTQTEASTQVTASEERLYDSAFDVSGDPILRFKDNDALNVLTINSEGDVDIKVDITYPGDNFSSSDIILQFRDDNKTNGATEQEKKSVRFLPRAAKIFPTETQAASASSAFIDQADSANKTLEFHISNEDVEKLFKGTDDASSGTNSMYWSWSKRTDTESLPNFL
jgi:PKD repeat protein